MKPVYETNIDITEMKKRVEEIDNSTPNPFLRIIRYVTLIPRALCEDINDRAK
ncbi:MAG: hypothetical protein KJ697_02825 [Nanoarchaeota archaeon]|nr:hypothetical protein [Nanoarchaeota archaeon]MBU4124085.1 hypothetical protein [Nanoarchaeota archaeon]